MGDPRRILTPAGQQVMAWLVAPSSAHGFYLAGGTGLALLLEHRVSVDFDLFSATNDLTEPRRDQLLRALRDQSQRTTVVRAEDGTLMVQCGGVSVSFFRYSYPLMEPAIRVAGLAVASLTDIAAMKLAAIVGRGSKRDFIDLYFLSRERPLDDLLDAAETKYGAVPDFRSAALRALVFFDDADAETMPSMLRPLDWAAVKTDLRREVRRIARAEYGLD